jgi:hypothetical protein
MKKLKLLGLCFGVSVLTFSTGCQSTLKTAYRPSYTATYIHTKKLQVTLANVSDKRSGKPAVYYQNSSNGDTGAFDRPVADLVREAIAEELKRAGLASASEAVPAATLNCEVLDLKATITQPFWSSATLDLFVVLRFEWRDAKTNSLIEANERSERRSRKLGTNVPSLPFGASVVQDFGNEMINDMLPRVIEKEFHLASVLRGENN